MPEIVGVQKRHIVPGCHARAFVHGIIQSFVRFGYIFDPALGCIFPHYIHGAVRRIAVDHDMLNVFIGLIMNGFQTLDETVDPSGFPQIENNRDYTDFAFQFHPNFSLFFS